MKTYLSSLIVLSVLLFTSLFSLQLHAQQIEWAVAAQGLGFDDTGMAVTTRENGDIYHAGNLDGETLFGPGESLETLIEGKNYVARHNADGELTWATAILSDGTALAIDDIAVDPSGNAYIAGSMGTGSLHTFGPGEATETTIGTDGNSRDMYLAKFDSYGGFEWVRQAGISEDNGARSIVVDPTGASYVTGFFRSHAIFGAEGSTPAVDLFSEGGELDNDIFIAKYDTHGDLVWAKSAGGATGSDTGIAIDLDHKKDIYLTGHFRETATFGKDTPASSIVLSGANETNAFVARYSSAGVPVWAVAAEGVGATGQGRTIATDQGELVVAGQFDGTLTFGSTNGATQQLTAQGTANLFVARYNRKGELLWLNDIFMDAIPLSNIDVGIGKSSQGCVLGNFQGMATFGSGQLNETTLDAPMDADQYFACYSESGEFQWVEADPTQLHGGAMTHKGEIIVTGGFQDMPTFGPGDPNAVVLDSEGGRDIYLAKYVSEKISGPSKAKTSVFSSAPLLLDGKPDNYTLDANYPNPFNPQTTIRFGLPESAQVRLIIYDVTGKAVSELVNGSLAAGSYEIAFDAGDLPSGLYLYRLISPSGVLTGRMALVK